MADVARAVGIIKAIDRNIPLVLQPEFSSAFKIREKLELFKRFALEELNRVYIIYQAHKYLGIK